MKRWILTLAGLGGPMLFPGLAQANKEFCLELNASTPLVWDASPRSGTLDYGEDIGRKNSSDFYVPRMWVHIETMSGTQVYGGMGCDGACIRYATLDGSGCTGPVNTPSPNGSEVFKLYYKTSGASTAGWEAKVYDCSSSNPSYPACSLPVTIVTNISVVGNVEHHEVLSQTATNWTYWSLAQTMERHPAPGINNNVYADYYDSTAASNAGIQSSGTVYAHGSLPTIRLIGNGYRSKFTVAHEYGHVLSLFEQFAVSPADFHYCYPSPTGTCTHSLTTTEYQHIAAAEGFANFFGTAAWNNYAQPSARWFGEPSGSLSGTAWNAESGEAGQELKYYETNSCSGGCVAGAGVEIDWMRALWDFYTDTGTHPTIDDIAGLFGTNFPFVETTLSSAYYDDFVDAVDNDLGGTMQTRFIGDAGLNGIDH